MPPLMLQRVCDKGPYTCNVKGGDVPFAGTDLHIISNYLPEQWWSEKTRFNREAIYRRISVVHWHYAYKKIRLYRSDEGDPTDESLWAMTKFLVAYRKEFPIFVHNK